jgi:acetylornithine deacetylase/succinyl-diaminopimelate desuccinylase-like protein
MSSARSQSTFSTLPNCRTACHPWGSGKLCMYNHYDVEPIHKKSWRFDPFCLTIEKSRIYGRGVADNKAVLWTRILCLEERFIAGLSDPAILWLIQGEEEVGPTVSYEPFKAKMSAFKSNIYLEETGYHTRKGNNFC